MMHPDDEGFHYASETDWDREAARELGSLDPNVEYVLTDRDVWHKNPYYTGVPGRHPEDDHYDDDQWHDAEGNVMKESGVCEVLTANDDDLIDIGPF